MAENFAQRTDYVADTQVAITDQFKKPVISSLASIIGRQVQDLENTLFEVLNGRGLATAIGDQLDGLGALVGEARQGRVDDTYRIWIGARIKLNVSSGTPDQIIELVRILIDVDDVNPVYTEYPPAGFIIETVSALDDAAASQLGAIVAEATPAGVNSAFVYATVDDSDAFTFADTAALENSVSQGFSDNDPDSVGGSWASLINT